MIWLITLISQIWLGIELFLPTFYRELSIYSIVASGALLGIPISTFIFYFTSYFFGFNLIHLIIHTIFLLIIDFLLNKKRRKTYDYTFKENIITIFSPIIVSFVSLIFIFPIMLTNYGSFLRSIIPTIHEELSLRASFLYGVNKHRNHFFLIDHPDCVGNYVVSRWLTSYHMSMLNLGFGGLRTILMTITIIYLISFFFLLLTICIEFRLHFFMCPLSVCLPLLIAGFGYFDFHKDCEKYHLCDSNEPDIDYVSYFGKGFNHDIFMNPLFHIIVGNIPMGYAMGLSTLCLFLLYRSICCQSSCSFLKIAGFIIGGILPSVSHQSFFALLTFSSLNCLFQLWRQKKQYIKQFQSFFLSLFISFVALNFVRYMNSDYLKNCFIFNRQYNQNIERGDFFPFIKYWFNAFGFYLFIIFGLCWLVFSIIEKQFTFILLLTFLIFNFWQTQPLREENMLTFYSFLFTFGCGIYLAIAQRFSERWSIAEFRGIFGGIFFVITFFGCFSEICGIFNQILSWESTWDNKEIKISNWILKNTDEKSVFLSNRNFLDPVVSLCGRSLFLTNDYLHKKEILNTKNRKKELHQFIKNSNNQSCTISKIVDYIVVWKNDLLLEGIQLNSSNWKKVYNSDEIRIYKNIK